LLQGKYYRLSGVHFVGKTTRCITGNFRSCLADKAAVSEGGQHSNQYKGRIANSRLDSETVSYPLVYLRNVDLNLLVLFEVIYTERSLTGASQKLNLTQPAVSHALSRLRSFFQDPLFVRQGKQMTATPLSHSLIGQVRTALRSLEVSLREHRQFVPADASRAFSLGLNDVLKAAVLPELTERLQTSAPGIELVSVRLRRREIESELIAGTLDLAVEVPIPVGKEIRQRHLRRTGLSVVARAGHPAIKRRLTLKTYLAQEHIQVSSRRKGVSIEDFELNRQGYERRVVLRCHDYLAACQVVSRTNLLLTMPEGHARLLNAHLENRVYPFPTAGTELDVLLYWNASVENDPGNAWLRDQIIEVFQEEPPHQDPEKRTH
jgi:DNA-binding transcriptional LysR family regulator